MADRYSGIRYLAMEKEKRIKNAKKNGKKPGPLLRSVHFHFFSFSEPMC